MCYILSRTGYRHLFSAVGRDQTRGDRLDPLERVCRVVTIATLIADTDHHVLKDHEARFVLKGLAPHSPFSNRSLAILAPICEANCHFYGNGNGPVTL